MPDDLRTDEHEDAFVTAFILPDRRDRYRTKLRSPKERRAFLDRLNHRFIPDLDDRFIASDCDRNEGADANLCYVIADEEKFDGKLVTPEIANEFLESATFGIVVSYVPGKLAVYKDESPSEALWLIRP